MHAIAFRCRVEQRYRLGYLFAQRAAEIPFPEEDLFVLGYFAEVYAWRATDEQAVCAFWIGKHAEAFTLCRRLLARPDIPDRDRQRIAANRDFSVPAMIEAAAPYPEALVQSLAAGPGEAEVTVSLIAGPDRQTTEQTINSFLTCCLDVSRVGRFLVLDTGLSAPDRAKLQQRYGFLEFARRRSGDKPAAQLAQLRAQIDGRFWLHLGEGWRFFAPENYITRLTAVLDAEPQVFQVGINFADAVKLTGASAAEQAIRRAPDAGRYLLTEAMATRPGDVRHRTPGSGRRRAKQRPRSARPTWATGRPRRAAHRQPRRSALHLRSGPPSDNCPKPTQGERGHDHPQPRRFRPRCFRQLYRPADRLPDGDHRRRRCLDRFHAGDHPGVCRSVPAPVPADPQAQEPRPQQEPGRRPVSCSRHVHRTV